jgi:hypothetical protein
MSMVADHEARANGSAPRQRAWPPRLIVILLGALLGAAIIVALSVGFFQGSWGHAHISDRAIDQAHRSRLEATRDALHASGLAPAAVMYLDAALVPNIAPTTMRDYLIEAREALLAMGDPELGSAIQAVELAIAQIRSRGFEPTVTPHPLPTVVLTE